MNGAVRPVGTRPGRRSRSANDRMKAAWGRRVGWSMIAAVLVHLGVFLLLPDWAPDELPAYRAPRPLAMEGISSAALSSPGGGHVPPPVPAGTRPDSTPEEGARRAAGAGAGSADGAGAETASRSGDLRERLTGAEGPTAEVTRRRRASAADLAPAPAAADPEPDSSTEEPQVGDEDDGATSIGGRADTATVASATGERRAGLGRLRGLEADVTAGLGSASVLLQNHPEVAAFMRRAGRRNRAVSTVDTWVSITVWIDESGTVEWAEVSESSRRESLDEIALTLFEDIAEFAPAREGGERVPQTMIFQISFPWRQ